MSEFLIGALSVLMATNKPAALTNLVWQRPGLAAVAAVATGQEPEPTDPVERELKAILQADDEAQAEVDLWIRAAEADGKDAQMAKLTLKGRIEQRFAPIRKRYEDLIERQPKRASVRLAYGSFLGDIGEEEGQIEQYEKAREIDPTNPAPWNNLANLYGHFGPVDKAFEYYEKAVTLNPLEPVYWHNFATTVFLFRKDAAERWKVDEQGVFRKALDLYSKARDLKPHDFVLASDIAETYYGIKPAPAETAAGKRDAEARLIGEAMQAWTNALTLSDGPIERQGVLTHLARWHVRATRFDEARTMLEEVTDPVYRELRRRIERSITNRQAGATSPKIERAPAP